MRHFGCILRQRLVVIGARRLGVQRQVELIFPAKLEACLRHRVVPDLRTRMALCEVRRVGCDLVRDHPLLHVILVR